MGSVGLQPVQKKVGRVGLTGSKIRGLCLAMYLYVVNNLTYVIHCVIIFGFLGKLLTFSKPFVSVSFYKFAVIETCRL